MRMRLACLFVALVASGVPARASTSCMTVAEARAAHPGRHLWWHGREHCWDASPGARETRPRVEPPRSAPPLPPLPAPRPIKDDDVPTILFPTLVGIADLAELDPQMLTAEPMESWPLLLDVDQVTADNDDLSGKDYCCWPALEPDFRDRWTATVSAINAVAPLPPILPNTLTPP
jgi:hypothetical protein